MVKPWLRSKVSKLYLTIIIISQKTHGGLILMITIFRTGTALRRSANVLYSMEGISVTSALNVASVGQDTVRVLCEHFNPGSDPPIPLQSAKCAHLITTD